MSRHAKPYLKCEKRDGRLHLTLMKGGPNGHILGGRANVPAGDEAALVESVIALVRSVRLADQKRGIQADGNG